MLDQEGKPEVFWAVWEKFAGAALNIGAHLNAQQYWKQRKVSAKTASSAFDALLAAVFLNQKYIWSGPAMEIIGWAT